MLLIHTSPHMVISNKCTSTLLEKKKRHFSSHFVNRVYIYGLKLHTLKASHCYLRLPTFNPKSLLFPQSLSPRVLTAHSRGVLCHRRSTGPLINRLELLTGGSSILRRPCHSHYCISIMPHSGDRARKERRATTDTSLSLAF